MATPLCISMCTCKYWGDIGTYNIIINALRNTNKSYRHIGTIHYSNFFQ